MTADQIKKLSAAEVKVRRLADLLGEVVDEIEGNDKCFDNFDPALLGLAKSEASANADYSTDD